MTFIVLLVYLTFFIFFQSSTVYGGDGGDFVAAALTGGFAHAPGYPLYSILGYLLAKIPLSTPAWRVSLLSSIPAAFTLTLVFRYIYEKYNSALAGFLAGCILGGTYVFWLYSVVPEVFILNVFFTISIFYTLHKWTSTKSHSYFLLSLFLFSLSLAHHHIILFMLPCYAFIVSSNRELLPKLNKFTLVKVIAVVGLGLSPYLWLFYAAITIPQYYWGDPTSIVLFLNIVSRAYYGTFIAAQDYNQTIATRFEQIPALFEFYADDFLLVSLLIALIGIYHTYRVSRGTAISLIIAFIMTGPAYFLYASYDYSTPYRVAVAERFLLPSYLVITLFIGAGIAFISQAISRRMNALTDKKFVSFMPVLVFALIPLYIISTNYYKIGILKNDLTAERFAEDILNSKSKGSKAIFLLQNDNSIFDAQYLHLWQLNKYSKAIPINPAELSNGFNHRLIHKYYAGIKTPEYDKYHPVADFILKNYDSYEIYTDLHDDYDHLEGIKDGEWIPYGLLFRYYKANDIPSPEEVMQINNNLWNTYHNPLDGSLKYYDNLQLAHVLEFYQFGRARTGIYALEHGLLEDAQHHLEAYKKLSPTFQMKLALIALASVYIDSDKCDDAGTIVKNIDNFESEKYYQVMIQYHTVCTHDQDTIEHWNDELVKFEKRNERGLEEL